MSSPTPSTRRLVAHALGLVLVLVGLVTVLHHDAPFDSDEGALLTQVEVLDRTGTWSDAYWAAELDPEGQFVPIQHAGYADGRVAPLTSRPLHTVVVGRVIDGVGRLGLDLVSCAVAGVAALTCGLVARRTRGDVAVLSVWLFGLGTGVAFSVTSLRGHTVGTALAALAVLAAVRILDPRSTWRGASAFLLVLAPLMGVLFRRETLLLAAAVALALLATAVWERRVALAGWALLPVAGAVAGSRLDRWLGERWLGGSNNSHVPSAGSELSFLRARVESLWSATLQPSDLVGSATLGAVLLLAAVLVGAVAVVRFRRRGDATELTVGLGAATALVLARVLLFRQAPDLVPGLFAAAPLVLWAALSLRHDQLHGAVPRFLAVGSGGYFVAVVLTQYSTGGGLEWGSRYLQLALVMVVPLVALAAVDLVRDVPKDRRAIVVALLATTTLALTASGLVAQRAARVRTDEQLTRSLAAADDTESRIVIATYPSLPRSAVEQFADEQRWLWVWADGLPQLLDALESGTIDGHEVRDAVLVTDDEALTDDGLDAGGWTREESRSMPGTPGEWRIAVIERQEDAP